MTGKCHSLDNTCVSSAPISSEAATVCTEELVRFFYVYSRHKVFRAAHSIRSSMHIDLRSQLWRLHAQPVIYHTLLQGYRLRHVDMYARADLEIFDRFFFSAIFTIQFDDQIGLHMYYHEGYVPLTPVVPEIVTNFVANTHVANIFETSTSTFLTTLHFPQFSRGARPCATCTSVKSRSTSS